MYQSVRIKVEFLGFTYSMFKKTFFILSTITAYQAMEMEIMPVHPAYDFGREYTFTATAVAQNTSLQKNEPSKIETATITKRYPKDDKKDDEKSPKIDVGLTKLDKPQNTQPPKHYTAFTPAVDLTYPSYNLYFEQRWADAIYKFNLSVALSNWYARDFHWGFYFW